MGRHPERLLALGCALGLALGLAAAARAQVEIDPATFGGVRARAIGPAVMSGRIAALDAAGPEPLTIYVGAASGGVWQSKDGGTTFAPVFDDHPQSIGAIRIEPSDPRTVWVGTGESWTRNSASVGAGVYRSADGGESWEAKGLVETERIARIAVHPDDGETVFVCATGHLWDANPERGVYRTTDGGGSWERVLYVDEDTGCSDLAMDPQDPRILYAGMWQFRRYPDFFESGGPGSGLYRSTDGGGTWEEVTRGLPAGEKGRIAVAVAPSRPSVVYALVEAKTAALYRSDDLGVSWRQVNASFNLQVRPFYFAHLVVDPADFERVYKPGFTLTVSTDGGRTFSSPFLGGFGTGVHPDHHALWIDPADPHHLILGTDGGIYVSRDRGAHWRAVRDLPVSQFYEVSVDGEWPYHVYGGLQDNGSWMGPSRAVGGVRNRHWQNLGFGDGFHVHPDPLDPAFVYLEYQGGNVMRVDKRTGETREIKPLPEAGDPKFRFNWNTPIHPSPTAPGTLYLGAQFLFRSRDRGDSWERISPDLTTDDPAKQRQEESGGLTIDNSTAENHTTIYTISESPRDGSVIWVGTDDGNLQVTRDGGGTWANVADRVPGLPPGTWVSEVVASHHDAGTVYATFDGHRTGDMAAYLYRSRDFGASWEALVGEGVEGFAHAVAEDPVNPDLLFLGTELGLFVTADGGSRWARFAAGLPKRVAIHDLVIHPREGDLIIATHGRGIYILDDLTPLRSLTQEVLDADVALLPSRPAVMVIPAATQDFPGDAEFVGRNPAEAAGIAYHLKRRHIFGDLKVEIYGGEGELLATVPGGKVRGMNRVEWPMRLPPPKMPPATSLVFQPFSFIGPRVPEGEYTVRLIRGKESLEGKVTLAPDPRSTHPPEDRRLQQETALRLYRDLGDLTYLVDAALDLRDQAEARAAELGGEGRLAARLEELAGELEALRQGLVVTSEAGWLSGQEKLREQLGFLYGAVNGYQGRPTRSQLHRAEVLEAELRQAEERFSALAAGAVGELNRRLERAGLGSLGVLGREEWEAGQERGGGGGPLGPEAVARLLRRHPLLAGPLPLLP